MSAPPATAAAEPAPPAEPGVTLTLSLAYGAGLLTTDWHSRMSRDPHITLPRHPDGPYVLRGRLLAIVADVLHDRVDDGTARLILDPATGSPAPLTRQMAAHLVELLTAYHADPHLPAAAQLVERTAPTAAADPHTDTVAPDPA